MKPIQVNDEILVKVLAGEAMAEEISAVEQWERLTEENRRHYLHLKMLWDAGEHLQEKQYEPNTQLAWEKVRFAIRSKEAERKERKWTLSIGRNILQYAAIAAVIMIGLVWWNWSNSSLTEEDWVATVSAEKNTKTQLADGSKVVLSKGSTLKYVKDFAGNRKIKLTGKAYFEVARDEKHPFEIEAGVAKVTVLGTAFEVTEGKEGVRVLVNEGKVRVEAGGETSILKAGEGAFFRKERGRWEVFETIDKNEWAYASGELKFKEESMGRVVERISAFYDTEVVLEDAGAAKCLLSAEFKGETLEEALGIIAATHGFMVERQGKKVILKGVCK